MSTLTPNSTDIRFSLLELDDAPQAAHEWSESPNTTPMPTIESVDNLYKGRFQGHATIEAVIEAIPELAAPVVKEPLYTASGAAMPGAYGTIRSMPNGSQQGLGVVGERYSVIQDSEAFKIMQPLLDKGIVGTMTAGVYRAKSWLYGEAGAFQADILPGDTIEARVLIGNSHDGSIPWSFGFPGNRVVCQNTFHMALSNALSKLMRVRHTSKAADIVKQIVAATELFGMEFVESADKFRMLTKVRVDETKLKEYTGYVFSKWADTSDEQSESELGGRVYAKVLENFEGGQGSQYSRGTAWGAYNAVTEYLSHQRSREGTSDEARFADLQFGAGKLLAQRALQGAYSMLNA